jgi:5-methylcytosine-specific restriction protein A
MLAAWSQLIADELATGTGASIAVRELLDGKLRRGLRIWFDDLDELHGPVAELRPHGLKSHAVRLFFGPFSARVLANIAAANEEDVLVARALVRSVARIAEVTLSSGDLDTWSASQAGFETMVVHRHHELHPDSEAAITETCRDVMVPLMAAMAELIGYDPIEVDADPTDPQIEGAIDRATVRRRERSPRNRLLCLRLHGRRCKVCDFAPAEVYGDRVDVIEVHHLEPLALLPEPRAYNPETDLVPLCPNCHRAVHTQRPRPIEPAVLREMMHARRD